MVTFARPLQCLAKFLNFISVSHKIITKPYSIEGKKTNKGTFLQRCQTIIIILLISTVQLLHGMDNFYILYDWLLNISVIKLSSQWLPLKSTLVYSLKIVVVHYMVCVLHTISSQYNAFQSSVAIKNSCFLKKCCFKSLYFLISSSLIDHLVPLTMMLSRILFCFALLNLDTFHNNMV